MAPNKDWFSWKHLNVPKCEVVLVLKTLIFLIKSSLLNKFGGIYKIHLLWSLMCCVENILLVVTCSMMSLVVLRHLFGDFFSGVWNFLIKAEFGVSLVPLG